MVLYIAIIIGLVTLLVFSVLGKVMPKDLTEEQQKFYKLSEIICISLFIFAFVLFIIAEAAEAIYTAFNIIGVIVMVGSVGFYFYRQYQFKKLKRK